MAVYTYNKIRYGDAPDTLANGVRLRTHETALVQGRYFAGVDLLNRLWYSASSVGSVLYAIDPWTAEHIDLVSGGFGSQFRHGTIDGRGYAWFGRTDNYRVYRVTEEPALTSGLLLTASAVDYEPRGALYDPDTGCLYWTGRSSTGLVRLFEVNLDGTLGTVGASYSPAATVAEAHDVIRLPDGDYLCALPGSTTKLLKFAAGTLSPSEVTMSAARNAGGMGLHHAFGYVWLGSDTTQGIGTTPPQLTKLDASGTVIGTKTFADASRVTCIRDDGEYLLVAVSGLTNRIEKIDPVTLTTEKSFPYGSLTGSGGTMRGIYVSWDEDPYPVPEFIDARLWMKADDRVVVQEVEDIYWLRNLGPQAAGPRSLLKPGGGSRPTRAVAEVIEGRQAVYFGNNPGSDYLVLDPVTSWQFLHDGSAFTIAVAFKPTDASADLNPLFATLDAAVSTSALGVRLTYDEANNTLRFVSCNGLGVDYTVDISLALQNLDAPSPMVVVLRVDPEAGVAELRAYGSQTYLAEYESATATPVVPGTTADLTTGFIAKSNTELTDALVGEVAVLKGYLCDYAFEQLARYLARRWLPA